MTLDKKRAILEAAAKACEIEWQSYHLSRGLCLAEPKGGMVISRMWNPIDNSADTASMCAMLDIDTFWRSDKVSCSLRGQVGVWTYLHDGTPEGKEAAWRLAASMVAAKVGGYTE